MEDSISGTDSFVNSATHGLRLRDRISVAYMSSGASQKKRQAKPSAADKKAAAKLRAIWQSKAKGIGLTQTNFSERAHVDWSQGAVSQYLNGLIPLNYNALLAFSVALGVDPASIRTDLPEQRALVAQEKSAPDDDFAHVLASRQAASLGGGSDGDMYAEAHKLKFRASSLARKRLSADKLKVYYGKGDSMEPTLLDGDAILFDTRDTTPEDDTVFVIWHENRLYVKRLRLLDDGTILIASDNPIGKWRKQVKVKPGESFQIEGKVKWIARWFQC